MGSSDDRNSKAIDASVGGLVWVRRRNGSWWPGRIMAHDEIPDSSLVSPKSGTPIKLLGRDDASVDWYNLEKSKRVKAFRCGEYDACIEMAKATASGNSKKAVKYARREDAIVHALEIENAHLAKDHPELLIEKDDSGMEKVSRSVKDHRRRLSSKGDEDLTDVAGEALQSTKSVKNTSNVKASKVQPISEKRRRTPNDSEDDGTEGNRRMRGLEDIGMAIGSKGNVQVGALLEDKQENDSMMNGIPANGSSRDCSPSMKRKRSPVVSVNEYSKKKNRRRPLTKVLENTAMVSVPVSCDELVNSDCSPLPGFSEGKVSAVINNSSDSDGASCENVDDSLNASENGLEAIHNKAKESEISSISVLAKDDSSNGLFDVPLIGEEKDSEGISMAACASPAATLINGIEKITSKWQVKGKRNSRKMSKRQEESRNAYAEEANNSSMPCFAVSDQKPHSNFIIGTQAVGRKSQLCDVKIEVKANYKPRNVPLISLRSKLYGEAIVGHPLTVEVLEDGSCGHIMSSHAMVDDANPKPSSKKRKPHFPPQTSSKSKKSSSLSIKTRCLSALSGQKRTVSGMKKVKTEKTKEEQIVACIPLKVVFSRINEAVKGSARQVHRAVPPAGNAEIFSPFKKQ